MLVCIYAVNAKNKNAGFGRARTIILKLVLLVCIRKLYKGNCWFVPMRKNAQKKLLVCDQGELLVCKGAEKSVFFPL